jgi:hypothetical protein
MVSEKRKSMMRSPDALYMGILLATVIIVLAWNTNFFVAVFRCYGDWKIVPSSAGLGKAITILAGIYAFAGWIPYLNYITGLCFWPVPFMAVSAEKSFAAATGRRSRGAVHLGITLLVWGGLSVLTCLGIAGALLLGAIGSYSSYYNSYGGSSTGVAMIMVLFGVAAVAMLALAAVNIWAGIRLLRRPPLPAYPAPVQAIPSSYSPVPTAPPLG